MQHDAGSALKRAIALVRKVARPARDVESLRAHAEAEVPHQRGKCCCRECSARDKRRRNARNVRFIALREDEHPTRSWKGRGQNARRYREAVNSEKPGLSATRRTDEGATFRLPAAR